MSWLASALNILGLWFLPKHKYLAMYLYILSSTCFLIWSVSEQVWSIVALQGLLLVLNIRTIIIWKRSEHYGQTRE